MAVFYAFDRNICVVTVASASLCSMDSPAYCHLQFWASQVEHVKREFQLFKELDGKISSRTGYIKLRFHVDLSHNQTIVF
jgi:hypothetical protein